MAGRTAGKGSLMVGHTSGKRLGEAISIHAGAYPARSPGLLHLEASRHRRELRPDDQYAAVRTTSGIHRSGRGTCRSVDRRLGGPHARTFRRSGTDVWQLTATSGTPSTEKNRARQPLLDMRMSTNPHRSYPQQAPPPPWLNCMDTSWKPTGTQNRWVSVPLADLLRRMRRTDDEADAKKRRRCRRRRSITVPRRRPLSFRASPR